MNPFFLLLILVPIIGALIVISIIRKIRKLIFLAILLAVAVWLLTNVVPQTKKWHPLAFIALSAVAGVLFQF